MSTTRKHDDAADWAFGGGGFAKLYGDRLAQSSLLDRDVATRWVFVFMLSQADAEGRYRCASIGGLARAAAVSLAQAELAVAELEAADPDSTTKLNEGRRIVRIPGGWQIVSYTRYREYRSARQVAEADRKRKQRHGKPGHVPDVPRTSQRVRTRRKTSDVRRQTAEEGGGNGFRDAAASPSPSLAELMAALKARGVDLHERESGDRWFACPCGVGVVTVVGSRPRLCANRCGCKPNAILAAVGCSPRGPSATS
jgi:hypothetical protein